MIAFILNDLDESTDQPPGSTVLDFVRYHKNLKGTKIGCREGDCGACTIMVGELVAGAVRYRTMTSCLMPLSNAAGKHIVTIEGINASDGSLTPVQQAMVDENGAQCGFCTVGFVMSLTNFCVDTPAGSGADAISAIDGNICRCTGYKSIERAAKLLSADGHTGGRRTSVVPAYFAEIASRLSAISNAGTNDAVDTGRSLPPAIPTGGGTDLYVQRPDAMAESRSTSLFYDERLRGIRDTHEYIEIGGSATVTDLLESPVMNAIFPNLYNHLKLVSSTPIRNMATLAGNFINASPIGDMTVWFLALDAELTLSTSGEDFVRSGNGSDRVLRLRDIYLGYKKLAKQPNEIISTIRFRKTTRNFRFNFEKVCKRTYLDIATVNTAISCRSELAAGAPRIVEVHIAAGGVSPIPLYLKETSSFLNGKDVTEETIAAANEVMQSEISPISDVRGTEEYKRLVLRQLFIAHFYELFGIDAGIES
ncbi:MAG: 2Fe-2S iron-sulfur cluster-binding protein [Pyrinomonadaceae bacterium]